MDEQKSRPVTLQFPELGKIGGVVAKDDPRNPTKAITLYQVELARTQGMNCPMTLPFVPAPGLTGGSSEEETPYHLGDWVVVVFLGGDPERPFIWGRYFDIETSTGGQLLAQYPRWYRKLNTVHVEVDKAGKAFVKRAKNQAIEVQDDDGTVRVRVAADGTVELGDMTALYKLIDERAATIFNDHGHEYIVSGATFLTSKPRTPGLVAATMGAPASIGSGQMTSKTKAG